MKKQSLAHYAVSAIIAGCLIFKVSGCDKTDEPEDHNVWLPQALKDIFLVKPGTYWIMEEVEYGRNYRDSVYVVSTIHDTVEILHPGSREPFALKERFRVVCYSPFYGAEYHFVTESADFCGTINWQEPCHFIVVEKYFRGTLQGKSRIYYYPDHPDRGWDVLNSGLAEPQVRITGIIDSLKPANEVFTNVRRVETELDRVLQNTRSVRYISPEAGIVKWEIPAYGVKWVNVRRHIVR